MQSQGLIIIKSNNISGPQSTHHITHSTSMTKVRQRLDFNFTEDKL